MSGLRVILLCYDDRFFSLRLLRALVKRNRDQLAAVGVVTSGGIPARDPALRLRHLLTLVMLYGYSGIAGMLRACRQGGSLRSLAAAEGISVFTTADVNSPQTLETIRGFYPDIIVHQSPQRVGDALRAAARLAILNRHGGGLPRFRGLYAPFWAWLEKYPRPAATILKVGAGWDDGDVAREIALDASTASRASTPAALTRMLMDASDLALSELLAKWTENPPAFSKQNGIPRVLTVPDYSDLLRALWRILRNK